MGFDRARYRAKMSTFFATVAEKHSRHGSHRHERCEVSGVYYVRAPRGSAALLLHSPLEAYKSASLLHAFQPDGAWQQFYTRIVPSEGRLVLFPSWLEHEVEVHRIDSPRISISVNFVIESRTGEKQ